MDALPQLCTQFYLIHTCPMHTLLIHMHAAIYFLEILNVTCIQTNIHTHPYTHLHNCGAQVASRKLPHASCLTYTYWRRSQRPRGLDTYVPHTFAIVQHKPLHRLKMKPRSTWPSQLHRMKLSGSSRGSRSKYVCAMYIMNVSSCLAFKKMLFKSWGPSMRALVLGASVCVCARACKVSGVEFASDGEESLCV